MPCRRRSNVLRRLFHRPHLGSWVTTRLLDEVQKFSTPEQMVLFLYIRALTRTSRFLPTVRRLARLMCESERTVERVYTEVGRAGLLTDQWLGRASCLEASKGSFVTIRALNELHRSRVAPEDQITLFRFAPYADANGRLHVSIPEAIRQLGLPGYMRGSFHRLQEAAVLEDRTLPTYLRP